MFVSSYRSTNPRHSPIVPRSCCGARLDGERSAVRDCDCLVVTGKRQRHWRSKKPSVGLPRDAGAVSLRGHREARGRLCSLPRRAAGGSSPRGPKARCRGALRIPNGDRRQRQHVRGARVVDRGWISRARPGREPRICRGGQSGCFRASAMGRRAARHESRCHRRAWVHQGLGRGSIVRGGRGRSQILLGSAGGISIATDRALWTNP